jgi:hypothetical protein
MALPIGQQIVLDIVAPPILTALWWLFSRGWANAVQGGDVSEMTRDRQGKGLWIVLAGLYLIMFGATAYFNLFE